MFWDIVGVVLSIASAIFCGVYTWNYVMCHPADIEVNQPMIALLLATIAAIVGFYLWFLILSICFGAKITFFVLSILAEIVDFIYEIYILPIQKTIVQKINKTRKVWKKRCRRMKKNIGTLSRTITMR